MFCDGVFELGFEQGGRFRILDAPADDVAAEDMAAEDVAAGIDLGRGLIGKAGCAQMGKHLITFTCPLGACTKCPKHVRAGWPPD